MKTEKLIDPLTSTVLAFTEKKQISETDIQLNGDGSVQITSEKTSLTEEIKLLIRKLWN